jgi:hypothetical protein
MEFWCWLLGHDPGSPPFVLTEHQVVCQRCFEELPGLTWVPVFNSETGNLELVELVNDKL